MAALDLESRPSELRHIPHSSSRRVKGKTRQPLTMGGGGGDTGRDFLMTRAQECITKGSILGTYLSVCLGWIKGREWTKCHVSDLFHPQTLEFIGG